MNISFDPNERMIVAKAWEKDRVICEQIIDNHRLVRQERISVNKVALVFKKIEFRTPEYPPQEMRDKYWSARKELNRIAEKSIEKQNKENK